MWRQFTVWSGWTLSRNPHAHFICEQCDAVIDVDAPCDDLRQELEQQYGCTVQRSEMLFRGVCARCKNKDI